MNTYEKVIKEQKEVLLNQEKMIALLKERLDLKDELIGFQGKAILELNRITDEMKSVADRAIAELERKVGR